MKVKSFVFLAIVNMVSVSSFGGSCVSPAGMKVNYKPNASLIEMVMEYREELRRRTPGDKVEQELLSYSQCKWEELTSINSCDLIEYLKTKLFCYIDASEDEFLKNCTSRYFKESFLRNMNDGAKLTYIRDHLELVAALRARKPFVTCQVPGQNSAVQNAILQPGIDNVDHYLLLFNRGADKTINRRGAFGMTALHFAAVMGNDFIVRHLLNNGAKASLSVSHNGKLYTASDLAKDAGNMSAYIIIDNHLRLGGD